MGHGAWSKKKCLKFEMPKINQLRSGERRVKARVVSREAESGGQRDLMFVKKA
jgi:hypothetical protein